MLCVTAYADYIPTATRCHGRFAKEIRRKDAFEGCGWSGKMEDKANNKLSMNVVRPITKLPGHKSNVEESAMPERRVHQYKLSSNGEWYSRIRGSNDRKGKSNDAGYSLSYQAPGRSEACNGATGRSLHSR